MPGLLHPILGRRLGIALAVTMALHAGSAAAQVLGELEPGARVRVNREVVGNVLSLDPDTLRVTGRRQQSAVAIDVASIHSLEVSTRRSHRFWGGVAGYLGGVVLAMGLAEVFADGDDNLAPLAWAGVVPVTVAVGIVVSGERWKRVTSPPSSTAGPTSTGR